MPRPTRTNSGRRPRPSRSTGTARRTRQRVEPEQNPRQAAPANNIPGLAVNPENVPSQGGPNLPPQDANTIPIRLDDIVYVTDASSEYSGDVGLIMEIIGTQYRGILLSRSGEFEVNCNQIVLYNTPGLPLSSRLGGAGARRLVQAYGNGVPQRLDAAATLIAVACLPSGSREDWTELVFMYLRERIYTVRAALDGPNYSVDAYTLILAGCLGIGFGPDNPLWNDDED